MLIFQASSAGADEVDDSVRDMWKTIETDPNIPPILTMPGLQSSTELVNLNARNLEKMTENPADFLENVHSKLCILRFPIE